MRRKTDPSNPDGMPWQRWLPHAVVFVRDRQGRVCALRTVEDGAPVELALGAVIVRAAPGRTRPRPRRVVGARECQSPFARGEGRAGHHPVHATRDAGVADAPGDRARGRRRTGAAQGECPCEGAGPLRVRGRRVPAGRPAVARGACQALPPGDSRAAPVHARPPRPAQPARPGALSTPHTRRSSADSTAAMRAHATETTPRDHRHATPTTPIRPSPL